MCRDASSACGVCLATDGERPVQRPRLIRDKDESEPYHGPPLELTQPLRRAKRITLPKEDR